MRRLFSCMALMVWAAVSALRPEEAQQFVNSRRYGGNVAVSEAQSEYIIATNGIPDHPSNAVPTNGLPRVFTYRVPKTPIIAEHPGCLPEGPIGITKTGVHIFHALDSQEQIDAIENRVESMDTCNGHVNKMGFYHYIRMPKTCLVTGKVDEFIGVAMDGFPIYGPLASDLNREVTKSDLDQCHGRFVNGEYRYHVTTEFPYFIGCFKGQTKNIPRRMDVAHKICDETSGFSGPNSGYLCTCYPTNSQTSLGNVVSGTLPVPSGFMATRNGMQANQMPGQASGRIINGLWVEGPIGTRLGMMPWPMQPNPEENMRIINGLEVNQPTGTGLGSRVAPMPLQEVPPMPFAGVPLMPVENFVPVQVEGSIGLPETAPPQVNNLNRGLTNGLVDVEPSAKILESEINNAGIRVPVDVMSPLGFRPRPDGTMGVIEPSLNQSLRPSTSIPNQMPLGEQRMMPFPGVMPGPTLLGFRPTEVDGVSRILPLDLTRVETPFPRPLNNLPPPNFVPTENLGPEMFEPMPGANVVPGLPNRPLGFIPLPDGRKIPMGSQIQGFDVGIEVQENPITGSFPVFHGNVNGPMGFIPLPNGGKGVMENQAAGPILGSNGNINRPLGFIPLPNGQKVPLEIGTGLASPVNLNRPIGFVPLPNGQKAALENPVTNPVSGPNGNVNGPMGFIPLPNGGKGVMENPPTSTVLGPQGNTDRPLGFIPLPEGQKAPLENPTTNPDLESSGSQNKPMGFIPLPDGRKGALENNEFSGIANTPNQLNNEIHSGFSFPGSRNPFDLTNPFSLGHFSPYNWFNMYLNM